jgi:alpha-glucosidase
MLDVPVRPHAWNVDKLRATSPAKRGELWATSVTSRLRYRLAPYYYSLAFRAHLFGEPVFPPLVHAFQADPNVRRLGSEKMIGTDLLDAVAADPEATSRDVYLPAGDWVDFHTLDWVHSRGDTVRGYSLYTPGYLQLPLFARAGAIIPMARVDDGTWNMLGRRAGGTRSDALDVRVFASALPTTFDVYEDDGVSIAYQGGAYAVTNILQELAGDEARVAIDGTTNGYEGLPPSREHVVEIVHESRIGRSATLNGVALAACRSAGQSACFTAVPGATQVRTGSLPVGQRKEIVVQTAVVAPSAPAGSFVCKNARPAAGQAVYAVGDAPALGGWDLARAVKLAPTALPTWSARIEGLPANARVTWKCVVQSEDGSGTPVWQPGADNVIATGATGYAGESAARL